MEQYLVPLEYILWLWLFDFIGVAAAIMVMIYLHRKHNGTHDAAAEERAALAEQLKIAAEERRTLISRIEALRNDVQRQDAHTNNYIIFNHTRRRIVEQLDAYITREGGWKITGEDPKISPEYVAKEVTIYVVLKDGESSELFGG